MNLTYGWVKVYGFTRGGVLFAEYDAGGAYRRGAYKKACSKKCFKGASVRKYDGSKIRTIQRLDERLYPIEVKATEPVSQEEANTTSTADQYDNMAEMTERPQRVAADRGVLQRRINNMVWIAIARCATVGGCYTEQRRLENRYLQIGRYKLIIRFSSETFVKDGAGGRFIFYNLYYIYIY